MLACKIDGNQRYSWIRNQRSLFVSRARPRTLRRKTINCRSAAFSAQPALRLEWRSQEETCDENHLYHGVGDSCAQYRERHRLCAGAFKGEVVTVDKTSKKIGIKLSGTVGPSDTTAPTPFNVQDARMFNAVKPGDKVSFTAEHDDGVMTIKEIPRNSCLRRQLRFRE